jgi:hypothetical protein
MEPVSVSLAIAIMRKSYQLTAAALCMLLLGAGIQLYASSQYAAAGWGRRQLRTCRLCSASDVYCDGIRLCGQFVPVRRRMDFASRQGRADCSHEWRWSRLEFTSRLSLLSTAFGRSTTLDGKLPARMIIVGHAFLVASAVLAIASIRRWANSYGGR